MEHDNDASEERNHPEHGRHDSGDTHIARAGGRRYASSANEATRDEDDRAFTQKYDKAAGQAFSHEAHPCEHGEKKAGEDG